MQTRKVQGSNNKHKVLLYTLSTCVWCKKTKQLLSDNDIEFEFIDVDVCNDEDYEIIEKDISDRGARFSFPTIIIDNTHLITGYKEDEIRKFLEI